MNRYEVQTSFVSGWENCWTESIRGPAGDYLDVPLTFATRKEAEEALRDYLEEQHAAVEAGDMLEEYPPEDFRIVEVK